MNGLITATNNVLWMPFYNYDTEEVPAHGVMRLSQTPTYSPDGHPILGCEKPDTTFDRIYVVNGPSPVPANGYGECAVLGSGPVLALCDASSVTPAIGAQWGPINNSWVLSPNDYGFLCWGGLIGSGSSALALFQPREITQVIGKTNGSLSKDGSVTVDVWHGSNASATATGKSITAYDWLLDTGQTVATSTEVTCNWYSNAWYLDGAKCA